jgi:uncharacterized protein involved in type VI secretion and phage assembly
MVMASRATWRAGRKGAVVPAWVRASCPQAGRTKGTFAPLRLSSRSVAERRVYPTR